MYEVGSAWNITYQSLCQEVDSERVGVGEELGEGFALAEGQCTDIVPRPPCGDGVELVERGRAQDVEDKGELVVIVPTGEQRLS